MKIDGSVIVVTGAGGGIGAALARRFAEDGAKAVIVADLDRSAAESVANEFGGIAEGLDAADADAVSAMVDRTVTRFGQIDIFCANAGVTTEIGLDAPDSAWRRAFDVNVMGHVYAARSVIPAMLERGGGYFVATASAAGVLTSPGDAPYTATKHAAVGFAEWLAVTYGDKGLKVSVVCPLGVATPMLLKPLEGGVGSASAVAASGRIISPEEVADAVAAGIAAESLFIFPHPEVEKFWTRMVNDPQRWLTGMHRLLATDPS